MNPQEMLRILDSIARDRNIERGVLVRGRIVACLYVLHRNLRNLFGDDEKRLAEFVS